MKKVLALFALTTVFVSCSDDDSTPAPSETPFFNLAEGNEWVYKRYYQDIQTGEYNFSGRIDSVKVTGQTEIEGHNYFVLNHRIYNNGSFNEENNEYLRINENGHLVTNSGLVKHPGNDLEYDYNRIFNLAGETIGEVYYQNSGPVEISVEGSSYSVYTYSGYFTPYGDYLEGIAHVMNYQPEIGLVTEKTRFLAVESYIEDRLVYYELN